jgi:hypothetical protein
MRVDRAVQLRILELCADKYPMSADPDGLIADLGTDGEDIYVSNVAYLDAHGLLDAALQIGADGSASWARPTITARGMDFLADDGGLTAILGTVTVKLHADTIRDMLIARVESSSESAEKKGLLRRQIAALPGTALQALTTRAAQEGLTHVPDLWHWVQGVIGV